MLLHTPRSMRQLRHSQISFSRALPRPQRRRGSLCVAARAPAPGMNQMLIYVPPHPLIKHWLAIARNELSPPALFRSAVAEIGRLLIYEAVREILPTVDTDVGTPMGTAEATVVDPTKPVNVVPVLRAGLLVLEQAQTVLPVSRTFHVGLVRDETSLQPSWYLNKLPKQFGQDELIFITECMLATGGTIMTVLDEIVARGGNPDNIRVITVVAAPPALTKMSEKYRGLKVYAAMIDAEVNEKGFIVPGLGDAGDRGFGTAM